MVGWSKGLTKETDDRVRRNSETKKRLYAEGKLVSPMKGKYYTEETKLLLKKPRYNLRGDNNPAKRPEVRKKISETKLKNFEERRKKLSYVFSPDQIKNMSESHLGNKNSPETIQKMRKAQSGEKHSMFGKHRSKKTRKKIGLGNKGKIVSVEIRKVIGKCSKEMWANPDFKKLHSGKNASNWQDGKSFEPYSTDWTKTLKRSIRERDNYTCQVCSKYRNIVHHWTYDKQNCNPEYLITLC